MSTTVIATGTCFDDAIDIINSMALLNINILESINLVHSICTFPNGRPYSHAWVEADGKCLFMGLTTDGEKLLYQMAKDEFYLKFMVKLVKKYGIREALKFSLQNEYGAGPWEKPFTIFVREEGEEQVRYKI